MLQIGKCFYYSAVQSNYVAGWLGKCCKNGIFVESGWKDFYQISNLLLLIFFKEMPGWKSRIPLARFWQIGIASPSRVLIFSVPCDPQSFIESKTMIHYHNPHSNNHSRLGGLRRNNPFVPLVDPPWLNLNKWLINDSAVSLCRRSASNYRRPPGHLAKVSNGHAFHVGGRNNHLFTSGPQTQYNIWFHWRVRK